MEIDCKYLNHNLIHVISKASDHEYICKICNIKCWYFKSGNLIYQVLDNNDITPLDLTCNEYIIKNLLE